MDILLRPRSVGLRFGTIRHEIPHTGIGERCQTPATNFQRPAQLSGRRVWPSTDAPRNQSACPDRRHEQETHNGMDLHYGQAPWRGSHLHITARLNPYLEIAITLLQRKTREFFHDIDLRFRSWNDNSRHQVN